MNMKLLIWITVFLMSASVAFAQGLFSEQGASSFLKFGVVAIITIFIVKFIASKIFIVGKKK